MDFVEYVRQQLETSPWQAISADTIRSFYGDQFAVNRESLNSIAATLAKSMTVFAAVETFANIEDGQHVETVLIVARSTQDYLDARKAVTRRFQESQSGDIAAEVINDGTELEQFYQDTVEYLKTNRSGALKMENCSDYEIIQHAMFLSQRGVHAVPVKLEAVVAGRTIRQYSIVIGQDEEAKTEILASLQRGVAEMQVNATLTILVQ